MYGAIGLAVAVVAALFVDRAMERRGLLPPRFADRSPLLGSPPTVPARLRRALGASVVGLALWASSFAPLSAIGEAPADPAELTIPQLFLLHGLLAAALAFWYALGYLPRRPVEASFPVPVDEAPGVGPFIPQPPPEPPAGPPPLARVSMRQGDWRSAFRLEGSPRHELAVGIAIGLAIWLGVLLMLAILAGLIKLLGGDDALPKQPPELVLWIGALPVPARAAIALSAGLVEEVFFRGFLQPRIGVLLSTTLFVLAHLAYGQPFMLIGVTLLSLLYAELARRRRSVWAPIAAHAVFDLVQLLVVVPLVARALELGTGAGTVTALASWAVGR